MYVIYVITERTDRQDITEILLNVALNTTTPIFKPEIMFINFRNTNLVSDINEH